MTDDEKIDAVLECLEEFICEVTHDCVDDPEWATPHATREVRGKLKSAIKEALK